MASEEASIAGRDAALDYAVHYRMEDNMETLINTLMISLALTGCPLPSEDPIVGTWESREVVNSERNRMAIADDLQGVATISLGTMNGLKLGYNTYISPISNGKYEIAFECDGDCAFFDFNVKCELWGNKELDCRDPDNPAIGNLDWRIKN